MQENPDYIREDVEAPNNDIRIVNKWRKRLGCLSIVGGIILVTITISTSGLTIIPLIIGGYLVMNGLINTMIKL